MLSGACPPGLAIERKWPAPTRPLPGLRVANPRRLDLGGEFHVQLREREAEPEADSDLAGSKSSLGASREHHPQPKRRTRNRQKNLRPFSRLATLISTFLPSILCLRGMGRQDALPLFMWSIEYVVPHSLHITLFPEMRYPRWYI